MSAEELRRAVGDHLIGVHIRRGAGAALNRIHDKGFRKLAVQNLVACRDDGLRLIGFETSDFGIDDRRGLLDFHDISHKHRMKPAPRDPEIAVAAQRLHAVISIRRHRKLPDGIPLDSQIFIHDKPPLPLCGKHIRKHASVPLSIKTQNGKAIRAHIFVLAPYYHRAQGLFCKYFSLICEEEKNRSNFFFQKL